MTKLEPYAIKPGQIWVDKNDNSYCIKILKIGSHIEIERCSKYLDCITIETLRFFYKPTNLLFCAKNYI